MNKNHTIYIVEDDDSVRKGIATLISSWGANHEAFASAEEYLESASGSRPGCLLLDHLLGGIDGLTLQKELIARNNTIPVVAISGHTDVQMAIKYWENGALTLLEKPLTEGKLKRALESAIEFDIKRSELTQRFRDLKSFEESLSTRERLVLHMVVGGKLNKSIAKSLEVSQRTVENTRARVLKKFHADTATELAAKATELKVLSNVVFRTDSNNSFQFRKGALTTAPLPATDGI